jgi:preprotein translocase subunit SecF
MAAPQKFFEVIKPGINIDFIGKQKVWIGISLFFLLVTILMLPLNAYVIPGRGHMLNWGIDFRGGSEIQVELSKPVDASAIRSAVAAAGFHGADVVKFGDCPSLKGAKTDDTCYLVRLGAVSILSGEQAKKAEASLAKVGDAALKRFETSEGGDKIYVRFDKAVELPALEKAFAGAGVSVLSSRLFGRAEDNNYEVTLKGLDTELRKAIDEKLGAGTVKSIPQANSVGAKAGKQLRNDGINALLGAIVLIVVYVAFRFDFRYGPGTIVALVHDALLTVGAFAVTYKEFSLTTLAALLTIIGFSMNDTIVVFDRIRENAAKYRDRAFDKVVNGAINETLSRTILTSTTVFLVTLTMNIVGTGVVRDFAFAMNVGVIVGTYSSIFIASPILIWLNAKFVESQKRQSARPDRGQARKPVRRRDEDADEAEEARS